MEEKFYLEKDRIPVFIGVEGSQKKEFEEKFRCTMNIDSNNGEVLVDAEESIDLFVLGNVISAINYGHNPKNALLLEDENFVFDIIDVKVLIRDSSRLKIVLGRVIGKEGSTRKLIEEITKCSVSVRDHFVSIIGPYENSILVHEALDMLIKGASHKSFYAYLEKNKSIEVSGLL